jgi:hypothetical protein
MNLRKYLFTHRPRHHRYAHWPFLIAAAAALAALPATGAQAAALPALTCTDHTLAVRIADPGPADQTLWGQLATAARPHRGAPAR